MVTGIEGTFPKLVGKDYQFTSPRDKSYNCIAWAIGINDDWWWPGEDPDTFWPAEAVRVLTIEAFRQAFATKGFEVCENAQFETSIVKIALFATAQGLPTHAARQLMSGRWTSKLGTKEDIEHDLYDLEGDFYGSVVLLMKRPANKQVLSNAP